MPLSSLVCLTLVLGAPASELQVTTFLPEAPLNRAERPSKLTALIENYSDTDAVLSASLECPTGVEVETAPAGVLTAPAKGELAVEWTVVAALPGTYRFRAIVRQNDDTVAEASADLLFLEAIKEMAPQYIPEPEPVKTPLLIGAHHCPLWEADRPEMWAQLLKHRERTPALGFYAQENPEISDWETKWAVEHGVSFFIYCWYRASQGGPVEMRFGSAIHDALFKSRYADKMKFTIMWENQSRGQAGVSDEADLMNNLMPFWVDNYFRHPSYLKVDNKPLLFIYRPEFLIDDLGGEANVVKAFDAMRQACRDAGFDGLYLLGEYRGLDPKHLEMMKRLGLDYTFAYCWHVQNSPAPEVAIDTQLEYIRKTQEMSILPQVITVSQGWSGWHDEGSIWKLPPESWRSLLERVKPEVAKIPEDELGSRMLILDNWNEWGEGHYLAPHREYGFGYLDAVRDAFAREAGPHTDIIPQDIGLGPYDTAYKEGAARDKALRKQVAQEARKEGADTPGLVAWWAFDEDAGAEAALDYSGNRLGGIVRGAARAEGVDGNALVCDGGCIEVPSASRLSVTDALTIECWVKTDTGGQGNNWVVNRVFSGGTHTGYRMGVLDGHPSFEVPLTSWSHHLKARDPLPLGQWVHLAGTYDGQSMRLYVNGIEQGAMERPGKINTNDFHLILGNYAKGHAAHFKGLLDEVRLYDRALDPDEIAAHYAALKRE